MGMVFLFPTFNFFDRSGGGSNNFKGFFFPSGGKNPSQNLKNGWNHSIHQKAAIFVKKLNCNISEILNGFFYNPRDKNSKIGGMGGKEENLLVIPEKLKPYPFCHTFWIFKRNFFKEPCMACLLARFLSYLKYHPIYIPKPIAFSRFFF